MKGIYQANSILILNLGVEMIFIIDQRLRAQNIEQDKIKMVINDLVIGLFADNFQNNFSKPTKIITHDVCYQLIHQLAHSSIMKLGDDSMSKLYELICMTLKYHLIHSSSHFEIYLISLKHMQELETLDLSQQSIDALNKFRQFFINLYTQMNSFDYMLLRQELLRFFQQKYIRVQLFLNEKWQNQDGSFKVNLKRQAGFYVQKPGQITLNQEGFPQRTFFVNVEQTGHYIANPNNSPFNGTTVLGINLYSKQYQKSEQQKQNRDLQKHDSNKSDLNQFAQMIRIKRDDEIDLFSNKKAEKVDSDIVKIEVTDSKSQAMKNNILKDFNIEMEADEDLLDLMDQL